MRKPWATGFGLTTRDAGDGPEFTTELGPGLVCSWCGRRLGIFRVDGRETFEHGWRVDGDRLVFAQPKRRRDVADVAIPGRPRVVVCRYRDCGELLDLD